jgi:hypothetical protein
MLPQLQAWCSLEKERVLCIKHTLINTELESSLLQLMEMSPLQQNLDGKMALLHIAAGLL